MRTNFIAEPELFFLLLYYYNIRVIAVRTYYRHINKYY